MQVEGMIERDENWLKMWNKPVADMQQFFANICPDYIKYKKG